MSSTTSTAVEGEDRVLATAQQIVKSLKTSKDVTDDMLLILSSFDNRLSSLLSAAELSLSSAEHVITAPSSASVSDLLSAVDHLIPLSSHPHLSDRADSLLHSAISTLQDRLSALLNDSVIPLDADRLYGSIHRVALSFSSMDVGDVGEFDQIVGSGGGSGPYVHERGGSIVGELSVEVVDPSVVCDLREIVERMVRAGYEKECCQVYSAARRDGLEESLRVLGVERVSIEEVLRVEWREMDDLMKRWVMAVKVLVKVLLVAEKRLCDQVFDFEGTENVEGGTLVKEVCFVETAKGSVMQVLNFGEAVAIGRRTPEKLFRILDMYEALRDCVRCLEGLFGDESGRFVVAEARGVLDGLGEAARGTFAEFEGAVKGEVSRKPVLGGEVHPLGRYVMNYCKLIVDYGSTLNELLECEEGSASEGREGGEGGDGGKEMSALGTRLMSLINSLESNLEEKAKVYEDVALQYIFLMNNKHYIVHKVKDSELGKLLGDDWVKRRRGHIRKYATNYLRASWSKVLACLRDEGVGSGSSSAFKLALKERFKNFNASFEEIYRTQSGWKVPDAQLRTELRISISEKVIPAYRSFLGRFGPQIESGRHAGKYIKYTAEDLDGYLADLFEGTPVVLHHMRRKSS